jgi:ketopantoate reductase
MTKICIFGAGAIGGMLAHALHKAGAEVSLVARGPHLIAIQENGLTFIKDGVSETIKVKASDNPADFAVQDYVIITLKAHSVPPIVDQFAPLIGPDTAIVSAVNGMPLALSGQSAALYTLLARSQNLVSFCIAPAIVSPWENLRANALNVLWHCLGYSEPGVCVHRLNRVSAMNYG